MLFRAAKLLLFGATLFRPWLADDPRRKGAYYGAAKLSRAIRARATSGSFQGERLGPAGTVFKSVPIAFRRPASGSLSEQTLWRQGRRWIVRQQLPRRMLLFSNGRAVQVVVGDFASASKVGRFMSAVSHFLRTNNPAELREFAGESVTDVSGRTYPFETRPNALYRLASAHDQSFEHIYRIVV